MIYYFIMSAKKNLCVENNPMKILNLNLNLKMLYSTQHMKTLYKLNNLVKQQIVFIKI